jgi:hypothetical protein
MSAIAMGSYLACLAMSVPRNLISRLVTMFLSLGAKKDRLCILVKTVISGRGASLLFVKVALR